FSSLPGLRPIGGIAGQSPPVPRPARHAITRWSSEKSWCVWWPRASPRPRGCWAFLLSVFNKALGAWPRYWSIALRSWPTGRSRRRKLLGRVVAHEVGHLLLGTTAHSATGLMRARWNDEEARRDHPMDWLLSWADARQVR